MSFLTRCIGAAVAVEAEAANERADMLGIIYIYIYSYVRQRIYRVNLKFVYMYI